ncbi:MULTISPECIES: D-2-hydroxyacid dehydrogenase family protein [unclassified Minwuia]|jgi:phosphoglycerate dehydrogenase-like enzyme|uniref:D-2-hydroxyacid dehydrogenase family protein n=1 Tax=unclassified Minwuia TaxID=2618799 RepID=UPI002479FD4C|nr:MULTISPECIES: D-2-hydroxyacid dehydrogenase family protein [unclassified Minwuia]
MKIAILDDYQNVARAYADWTRLPPHAELIVVNENIPDPDALAARLGDVDILCVMRERTPITAALMQRLPGLKLIVTTGMWNAAIDMDAASARNITVCGTEGPGHPTAELTFTLLLMLARRMPQQMAALASGGWQPQEIGHSLAGSTLGLIGLGKLGGRVAGYAQAFGMNVLAWSANLTESRAAEVGVKRVSFDELLASSDHVSVHVRLSERTEGLLDADAISRMKRGATLINTSRGPIIDVPAMIAALESGALSGAGIDVYAQEPLPADDPIRKAPNVILTPHVGYVSEDTWQMFHEKMLEDILAFIDGKPVRVIST